MTNERTRPDTSFWSGDRVRLRAVEPDDWPVFDKWNQDVDQSRRLDHVHPPMSRHALRAQVERYAGERPDDDTFRFIIEDYSGTVVGAIATHDCDRRVGSFTYGINILPEHRRQGYASEAIRLVARYYFRELRYQKLTVGIYAFNEPSIRLHESLGFVREGRLRRMGFTDGRHFDILMYGITAEEFALGNCQKAKSTEEKRVGHF